MIQLNSLQLPQGGEFYSIALHRLRFGLIDTLDLHYLQTFSRSNQAQLGKTEVRLQVDWLTTFLPFFKGINYVLLTQYQEILLLPYLLRYCPQLKVMATSLMFELARIHLLAIQEKLKDFDATSSELTYDEEMDIKAAYEAKFDIDLSANSTIFSRKQAQEALKSVVKVNYFQVHDTERGVHLIAHPSGKSNGSCLWELQDQQTKEKILFINDISHQQWRTCQSYNLNRLKLSEQQSAFHHVIFTKRGLSNLKTEGEQQRTADLVARIGSNMANSLSTVLILSDETTAIDLIPRIAFQPEGKCQAAFFSHSSLHDFTNFCNSYVDYLSQPFRNVIFSESPDYPLVHYSRLREKGLIQINGLEETAIRVRLPVKEVVLQNAPFVLFLKNYEHYLQTEDLTSIYQNVKYEEIPVNIENNFSKAHFDKLISTFSKAKIYSFGVEVGQRVIVLPFNRQQRIGEESQAAFMRTSNLTSNKIHTYTLVNNELQLRPYNREVLLLPRAFIDQVFNELIKRGAPIFQKDSNCIRTEKTLVVLSEDYVLRVSSSHAQQLLAVERVLSSMIEKQSLF